MRSYLRIALAGTLAGIFVLGAAVTASAHEPEKAKTPEPDPLARSIYLISTVPDRGGAPNRTDPYHQDAGLALSANASDSASPSRSYTLTRPLLGFYCGYPYSCAQRTVKGLATNVGEDFEIQWQDQYAGQLHYAWSYRASGQVYPYSDTVGVLSVGLTVGDVGYGGFSRPLSARGGDATLPMAFDRQDCEHSDEPHHPHCEAGSAESAPEIWTHDVVLTFSIHMPYQFPGPLLGASLTVKVDTGGGSFLTVHEVPPPPPPPPEPEPEAGADEPPVAVAYDEDGDGEPDLYFTPGPSLGTAALAAAGGAILLRRRTR